MLVPTEEYIKKVQRMSNHGCMLSIDTPIQAKTYDITNLQFTNNNYIKMTERIMKVEESIYKSRLAMVL